MLIGIFGHIQNPIKLVTIHPHYLSLYHGSNQNLNYPNIPILCGDCFNRNDNFILSTTG